MDPVGIILTVVLLAANFFFVGAEFSLIAARRSIIEPLALKGGRRARMTLWAIEHVSLMMAGAQLGITVCSLALGYVTKPLVKTAVEGPLTSVGVPEVLIDTISYVIAYAVVTYLHVVLGEMVPKNIALAGPERFALVLGPALVVIVRVFQPILWAMNATGNGVLRMFGVRPKNEVTSAFTRDEVAAMVGESREGGLLDRQDEQLLLGALRFEARTAGSVALALRDIESLPEHVTPAEIEEAAVDGFSRYPIRKNTGELAGYIHIKDVLGTTPADRDRPIDPSLIRKLPSFHSDDPVSQVLAKMQHSGAHLAAVHTGDEQQPVGIVTLEDMLEEFVGQIRDDSRSTA